MVVKELNASDALWQFRLRYSTQQDAAKALGITPAYLSDLLNGKRDISDQMLTKLGLKRIVVKATV